MSDYEIPRPTSGDVVELILDDHRTFEDLLRECRRPDVDRAAAREALSAILVAHAEAEEDEVYPELRKSRAIGEHEEEHGEEEHAEILEALEAFLEAKGTDTDKYDSALEELATAVNHHDNEEEQTILAPARVDVSQERRDELGVAFATRRNQLLEEGAGSLDQVRSLLKKAEKEGVIASEDAREKADDIKADAKEEAKEVEEASKEKAKKS
ncbi:hemerythrin domain-containing protein [Knoellia remsis]|nr:hemerythrin domain-containing protein [Knoellia remsis]